MAHPLDWDDPADGEELTPDAMDGRELAEAVELLAQEQGLRDEGVALLREAARRLRTLQGLREARLDRLADRRGDVRADGPGGAGVRRLCVREEAGRDR